ncbi:Ger(x)C family spore germination protein [Bacillus testis]|uniref:Ger(x)C family spore germination protein n=1 Tax=Bacillus testis TaxID=1622072 RepID=UPI00067F175C|nr:Ger(x)C family spore germination protein [Bacillus testis]
MRHKKICLLILMVSLAFTSGCWDEKLIKDTSFALSVGYDKKDGKLIGTYGTPASPVYPQSGIITTVHGHTVRELSLLANDKVVEIMDTSKIKVVLFGEKTAKEDGIYPYLDIFVRAPYNPINPYLMVVDGEAKSYITADIPNEKIPGNYYAKVIKAHVKSGVLPHVNLLKGSRIFHNKGYDLLVPYFMKSKDKTPVLDGLAVFKDDKYTGQHLNSPESMLYNLMNKNNSKSQPNIVVKTAAGNKPHIKNYVTVTVLKSKRKMDVHIKNGKVAGKIKLHLDVEVIESPKYNVAKKEEYLKKKISEDLTKKANKVIKKLQKADSDGLGIGQQLHSFEYDQFKRLKWKDGAYREADIKAVVDVTIKKHGLID